MFYRFSRSLLMSFLYLCMVPSVFAASDVPYQVITDKFFEDLSKGRYGEAFDQLHATNRWMKSDNPQQLAQLRSQFLTGKEILGVYRKSIKLAERETAGVFVHQLYMVMFDRGPIGIRFQYYKPEGTWMLITFQYFSDLNILLGQRAEKEVLPLMPLPLPPPAKPSAVDFQIDERTPPTPLVRNNGE